MTTALFIIVIMCFVLIGVLSIAGIPFGLPGTWIMLAAAMVIEAIDGLWRDPEAGSWTFNLWLLLVCALLALTGEILEFLSGLWGAKRGGSSRRGMWGAVIGGVVGAVLGTFMLPVPLVGSLIGSLLGTFAGALVMELGDAQRRTLHAVRPALGATIGRLLGTIIKIPIGITIFIALLIDLIW